MKLDFTIKVVSYFLIQIEDLKQILNLHRLSKKKTTIIFMRVSLKIINSTQNFYLTMIELKRIVLIIQRKKLLM